MSQPRAFSSDFDPEAFEVEWFNEATKQGDSWTEKPKQADVWTPKASQSTTWTPNYDE